VKPNVFSRRQGWKMLQRWRGSGWRLSLGNHRTKRRREMRIPRNGRLEVDLVLATCMEVSLRQILERLAGLGTVPYGRYSGAKGCLRTAAVLPDRSGWTSSCELNSSFPKSVSDSRRHFAGLPVNCIPTLQYTINETVTRRSDTTFKQTPAFQRFTHYSKLLETDVQSILR
jgi:hypothetical protein